MKVLITGDRGFVGSATRAALEGAGETVYGYDIMDGYDVRDVDQLQTVITVRRPDRILHLAAVARFAEADANPERAYTTNVVGCASVAQAASRLHVPVVYASTGSVYMPITCEPPITEDFPVAGNSVYGCSKLLGEIYIRQSTSPWIILRYAHLYGAEKRSEGLVGNFISRIERGLAPTLYGGKQSSDFTYIADVVRANVRALSASADRWNEVYNIGTGEELSAERAGQLIMDLWGFQGEADVVSERRTVDAERFVYDVSKAQRMLGFTAEYTFARGLEEMHGASR